MQPQGDEEALCIRATALKDTSALGDGVHHHSIEPMRAPTNYHWRLTMTLRNTTFVAVLAAVLLIGATGCAVTRGQETVGAYVDDATITTQIKSRFIENKDVDAS